MAIRYEIKEGEQALVTGPCRIDVIGAADHPTGIDLNPFVQSEPEAKKPAAKK
jgi:hypothetical protein